MIEVLSLGGGVQSTTVALMSCLGELPKLSCAIFADTGWEPAAVYAHVEWLKEYCKPHFPVVVVGNRKIRDDAIVSQVRGVKSAGQRWASLPYFTRRVWRPIDEDLFELDELVRIRKEARKNCAKLLRIMRELQFGRHCEQRGMIKRQCTKEYKIAFIEKYIKRELLGIKPRCRAPVELAVNHWFGISFDEWTRARTFRERWQQSFYPLIDMRITRTGCADWLTANGFNVPARSACIGCPFHSDDEWRAMRDERPEEWQDACEFDDAIRKCGGRRGDCFLHRSCVPLRHVDLRTDADLGYRSLFPVLNGCDGGNCFV